MKPLHTFLFAALFALLALSAHASTGTAIEGQSVSITVTSDGTPPFNYQWMKGDQAIVGATTAIYSISSVILADAGIYTVRVSNPAGSVLSDTATLIVEPRILPPTRATTHVQLMVSAAVRRYPLPGENLSRLFRQAQAANRKSSPVLFRIGQAAPKG